MLSTPIRKYRDVFRLVGRTPLSARDAFVPPKSARGPTAAQGDRPTSALQALNSSSYLRIGVLSRLCRIHRLSPFVSRQDSFGVATVDHAQLLGAEDLVGRQA